MLDVLTPGSRAISLASSDAVAMLSTAPLAPVSRAEKREAIDRELRANPHRNDNQIARICDVDHKTVAARRREIQIPNLGNSAKAGRDDGREKAIGRELAESSHPSVQAAVDQCFGAVHRMREERLAEAAARDESNKDETLIRPQREITIQHDNQTGEWILKQKCWPDDDGAIYINDEEIHEFIDALTDRLGYGRAP
jgi:hypothetical protein